MGSLEKSNEQNQSCVKCQQSAREIQPGGKGERETVKTCGSESARGGVSHGENQSGPHLYQMRECV